jgi:nucleotide-binding universal stress UspA family protein
MTDRTSAGPSGPPVIITVTTDDDRYRESRQVAMRLAADTEARLILYDWDAATVLGDPLPSVWSAEGMDESVPSELDAGELEAAGRAALATQLGEARERGIRATAWLPSEPGPEAFVEYAREHGATSIVLPRDLRARGALERLTEGPSDPAQVIREGVGAEVVLVPGQPDA